MYKVIVALLMTLGCFSLNSQAQSDEMVIATKQAPPFVIKNEQGEFAGISIELFEQIADELDISYRYVETDLDALISGLEQGQYDASIAALTVNAERETRVDFTHPFYTTGLAIAVPKDENRLMSAVSGFFSWKFFVALGGLCLLLFIVGVIVWLTERHGNQEQFGGGAAKGIGAGFWWAAVTMTTVGYGDKAPATPAGRVVGFIWMFAAIILISSFTAAIATSLTVSQLETQVQGVEDLPDVNVATLANSASADFLTHRDIDFTTVDSVPQTLAAMKKGQTDALVYDKPILEYQINKGYKDDIMVLPDVIDRQDYAIALPEGSPLREQFNTTLLRIIDTDEWREKVENLLGSD